MVPGKRTIPLPELKNMLCQQLEYYFSRENLSTDAYLISQMDADNYVPIVTISKFNQIRRLTEDLSLVVEVLRESAAVQVDEAGEKVRPNPWSGVLILREIPESTPLKAAVQVLEADEKVPISPSSVLILREIPEKTPLKEIEELFSSENCPKFSRCQFAHNNWYVLFDSDEDTQKAYRYLREEAKTFNGKPVMAQIKAKGITSAPFASYKNGIGNVSEADSYNAQNVNPQQQQQNPLQYTYTNAPNEGYNSQQVCPPFCPPTILQTWAPTTPACVDLGTVISVNGLSPQAAFRPLTSNSNRNNSSSRERQRGHRKWGKENCTSGIPKALSSLYEDKAHISNAKVANISDIAIKEIESFKFTVQSVEQFIQTCPSEYKVAGLYVIDSIVRTSKKLLGSDKDVFGPHFVKNITTTFQHLFKCSEKDRAKIIRVLNVWQKKKLFPNDVIETLLDMGHPNTSKEFKEPHKSSAPWKGWTQNTEESVQEKTELVTAEGICLSNNVSNCTNSMSQRSDIRLPLESNVGVRDSRPLSFQSAVLQPHIGASVAGRISPASSFTSTPAAGTSVQHRTSLVGVTSENPHVFHPISTQGVIYTNSPITLYSRIPATSTCPVSPAHPAVLEWAHSIAVSAPLQRLQRPVSSVGAFSQPLYKSEISTKQNGYPCVQSRSLAMAPWTSLCAIDLNSSQSSSQILTDFPARTTSASPTRMLPSNSIGNLNQSSESGAPSQPRYSASQPSTPLMIPHSMPNTNPFVTPDRVICSLPVTSVAACPMSAQATTSQTRVEKATKATIFDAIRQWQPCNPSFVDGTSSSQQSLSAVHVSLNMRDEECKNRLKLRQDMERVSPPPIFGTPVKILEDGLSRRLKNLFGDPSLMDFDKENDKPQQ